jgi:hypothetical protein
MSTSLKRLLDAEAARTDVPPAPVAAVVAGGQARVRRWRTVALAVAAAAAVLAIAIPVGSSRGGSDDQPTERPKEPGWSQLDGPWTDLRSIHFGAATVPRPPGWNVEVLTSTRDSALYASSSNNGWRTYRLYELRPDESVRQISSDVEGTPLADPMGSYVAWQDKSSGEIVVYDTSRHAEVARQPVERNLGSVNAVDGDTIFYSDASQTYAWRPAQGDPEPLGLSIPAGGIVSDVEDELRLVTTFTGPSYVVDAADRRVVTFASPTLGEFDPSGRYLALAKLAPTRLDIIGWTIRAIDAPQDTDLTDYDGDIVQTWWDPSGSLVLGTVKRLEDDHVHPDDDMTFYHCDPATGDCELIDGSTTSADAAPSPANLQSYLPLDAGQPE